MIIINLINILKLEFKAFFRQYFKSIHISDASFIIGFCFLCIVSCGFYLVSLFKLDEQLVHNLFTILTIIISFNLERDNKLFQMLYSKKFKYSKVLPIEEKYLYYIKIFKYEFLKFIDFGYLLIIINFNLLLFKYNLKNILVHLIINILVFFILSDIKQMLNLHKYNKVSFNYINIIIKSTFTGVLMSIIYLLFINFLLNKEIIYIPNYLLTNFATFKTILICVIILITILNLKFLIYKKISNLQYNIKNTTPYKFNYKKSKFINVIIQKDILFILRNNNIKLKIIENILKYNISITSFLILSKLYNGTDFFLLNKTYILGFTFSIIFMYDSLLSDITSIGNEGRMIKKYILSDYKISKLLKLKIKLNSTITSFLSIFSLTIIEFILKFNFIEFIGLIVLTVSFSICISHMNIFYKAYNSYYENSLTTINKVSMYKSLIINFLLIYLFGINFLIIDNFFNIDNSIIIIAIEVMIISYILIYIYRKKINSNKKEFYGEYSDIQK